MLGRRDQGSIGDQKTSGSERRLPHCLCIAAEGAGGGRGTQSALAAGGNGQHGAADGRGISKPAISVRTGDTPQRERARCRHPAEILITTPESLYLLLTSQAQALGTVDTVIIDEIHALVPTERGAHLTLSLERLEALTGRPVQRIGLLATQRPVEEVARFLGGVEVQGSGNREQGTGSRGQVG